jgi:hypothetical protein
MIHQASSIKRPESGALLCARAHPFRQDGSKFLNGFCMHLSAIILSEERLSSLVYAHPHRIVIIELPCKVETSDFVRGQVPRKQSNRFKMGDFALSVCFDPCNISFALVCRVFCSRVLRIVIKVCHVTTRFYAIFQLIVRG